MKPMQNDVPVVIVGAGPTGVMLAIELARRGVEVRVLDRQPARPQQTRAIGIHARTLEVFHQLGMIEEFVELGHRVNGVMFHTRAGRNTRAPFGLIDSPYPFLLTLSQAETQRILDEKLESLGASIDRGVEVVGIGHDAAGTALVLKTLEGGVQTLTADWLVGCDGARSLVRQSLGTSFDGDDYGQDWLMAEVNIEWPIPSDHFHVFAYTPEVLPAFPMPSDRWRVFVPEVPNRSVKERQPPTMEEFERLAAQRGPAGMKLSDPTLLGAFRCYRRHTKTVRSGRILVAGDAAHVHSPAGGQGMNTGLHDAFNLGWKLALVAHGHAPTGLLDTYQAERVPIAEGVLALTHALVRTFALASPRKRCLRDRLLPIAAAIPAARRRYVNRLGQVSHNYRGTPLTVQSPRLAWNGLVPGDRLPDVAGLELDGKRMCTLDLLGSGLHTLLVLTGRRPNSDTVRKATASLARWNRLVHTITIHAHPADRGRGVISDPELNAHRRYRATRGGLLLVRPDGYVACHAPLSRADIVDTYLERLTSSGRVRVVDELGDEEVLVGVTNAGAQTELLDPPADVTRSG